MLNLKTFSKLLIMDTPPQNICQYCGKSSKDFSQGKHQGLRIKMGRFVFWAWYLVHKQGPRHHWPCTPGYWEDWEGPPWELRAGRRGHPCKIWKILDEVQSGRFRIWFSWWQTSYVCYWFQCLKYMKQFFIIKTWNGTSRHFSYFLLHRARRLPTTYSTILWFGPNVATSNLACVDWVP